LGGAVGFTVALNLVLLATLVWTQWIGSGLLTTAWIAITVIWIGSVIASLRWCAKQRGFEKDGPPRDLFPRALGEYLRGNWFEVETLCQTMLRAEARDVEAQLLLTATLRHAGRHDEARLRLEQLKRYEAAAKWELEIENEMALLAEANEEPMDADAKDSTATGNERADDQGGPRLMGAA
jgi:hypothetical protein